MDYLIHCCGGNMAILELFIKYVEYIHLTKHGKKLPSGFVQSGLKYF